VALGESGGSVQLEDIAAGECSALIEVVENGRMNGSEFLKTSHSAEALHGSVPSSEWQV